jgi:hypothetical protein
MQQQLPDLVQERAMSERIQAFHQHTSQDCGESNIATEVETSDWEVRYVSKKGMQRRNYNSVARTLRSEKRRQSLVCW